MEKYPGCMSEQELREAIPEPVVGAVEAYARAVHDFAWRQAAPPEHREEVEATVDRRRLKLLRLMLSFARGS